MKAMQFLLIVPFLAGCSSIQSVTLTDPAPGNQNGKWVEASADGGSFLHLSEPSFEKDILEELRKQCSDGHIQGIQTILTTRELILIQYYAVHAKAFCIASK